MHFDRNDKIEIIENAISWLVAFALLIYGVGKIVQFDRVSEIDKTVNQMSGMELMWAFYGYSYAFAITLGILEVISAFLIFLKKTRIIGCLLASTILINVILQDIYYSVHLGALKAAILYQICIFIILWLNREKLIRSAAILFNSKKKTQTKKKYIFKIFIALCIFIILRIAEYYFTII